MPTITTHLGNYYFNGRNIVICFPTTSKFYGENNNLKKILSKLTGLDKFLIINKNQTSVHNMIKFVKISKLYLQEIYYILYLI